MARHGITGVVIGGHGASGGAGEDVLDTWRETRARFGRETGLGGNLVMGFTFHIADTQEKAIGEAQEFFEENMKLDAPLGFIPGLTGEQIDALADPIKARRAQLPTLEGDVRGGSALCGPPELIVEQLLSVQERYPGLEQVTVSVYVGTPKSVILEQLEWFGKEVMPASKGKTPPLSHVG